MKSLRLTHQVKFRASFWKTRARNALSDFPDRSSLYRANDFVFLRDPATGQLAALHLLFWPGILTTLTVLAFYLIGDGLRDALDPMLRNKR